MWDLCCLSWSPPLQGKLLRGVVSYREIGNQASAFSSVHLHTFYLHARRSLRTRGEAITTTSNTTPNSNPNSNSISDLGLLADLRLRSTTLNVIFLSTSQHYGSAFSERSETQKFYASWSRGLELSSTKASVLTAIARWIGVGSETGRGP